MERARVHVVRSLDEVEGLRNTWTSWQRYPGADIDYYLMRFRYWPEFIRPHVIVVIRDEQPNAMLVGRLDRRDMNDFKIGPWRLFQPRARVLSFIYGGLLGNTSDDNTRLMMEEVLRALANGEADIAELNNLGVDSPLFQHATRQPGFLSRDHFIAYSPHYKMQLPSKVEEVHQRLSKNYRWQLRKKTKALYADHPGQISVTCFREVAELERMVRDVEEVAKKTYQRGLGVGFTNNAEMRERLRLLAEKGWLRAYVFYIADKPRAFWIGTVHHRTFYSDYLGYDPEYGTYSPGVFLLLRMVEDFCGKSTEVREIDFGYGSEEYKKRFGNCEWTEALLYVFAPSLKGMRLKFLRSQAAFADRLIREGLRRTGLLPKIKRVWRTNLREG